MNKNTVSALACVVLFSGAAYAESLSDLHAMEATGQASSVEKVGRLGSGSGDHSPSQVVILNNTPSTRQNSEQNQISEQGQGQYQDQRFRQRQNARIGVGTGESLEALREGRILKEARNEQILMEKLEHSRMQDEKSRLRRLFKIREYNRRRHMEMSEGDIEFGGSISDYSYEGDSNFTKVEQEKVVNVVLPKATVIAKNTVVTPDVPASNKSYELNHRPWINYGDGLYFQGMLGMGSYKASNTGFSTGNWGLGLGKKVSHRAFAEFNVTKTTYEVDDPRASGVLNCQYNCYISQFRDLSQYNFSGVLGYNLINTRGLKGALKAGVSYVRRDSESSDIAGLESFRSNTVDGLLGAGVEASLTNKIALIGSFDYYTNLLNDIASTNASVVERVETSDYYVLGVGLKFKF